MTATDPASVGPLVEPRTADDFNADLLARVAGYLPGGTIPPTGPAAALLGVYGHFAATIGNRLNRAPDKNELAFLDMLGRLAAPRPGRRGPRRVRPAPRARRLTRAAGSQVGASVPGVDGPLIFATEHDIGAGGRAPEQVGCTWPGADTGAISPGRLAAGRRCTLFTGMQPMAHDLYLAHDTYLDLQGRCEVQVSLASRPRATPDRRGLGVLRRHRWTAFAPFVDSVRAGDDDSIDGTAGWTRSGTVVLRTPFATSAPGTVNGRTSRWIRARLAEPLTGDIAAAPPTVAHVTLSTLVAPPIGSLRGTVDGEDETGALYLGPVRPRRPLTRPVHGDSDARVHQRSRRAHRSATRSPPSTRSCPAGPQRRVRGAGGGGRFHHAIRATITMSTTGNQRYLGLGPTIIGLPADLAFAGTLPLGSDQAVLPVRRRRRRGNVVRHRLRRGVRQAGCAGDMVFSLATTGREVSAVTGSLTSADSVTILSPTLMLEYFDGHDWTGLDSNDLGVELFSGGGHPTIQFTVPDDLEPTEINGQLKRWVRIKITSGFFGVSRTTVWKDSAGTTHQFDSKEAIPPALDRLRLAYYFRSDPDVRTPSSPTTTSPGSTPTRSRPPRRPRCRSPRSRRPTTRPRPLPRVRRRRCRSTSEPLRRDRRGRGRRDRTGPRVGTLRSGAQTGTGSRSTTRPPASRCRAWSR